MGTVVLCIFIVAISLTVISPMRYHRKISKAPEIDKSKVEALIVKQDPEILIQEFVREVHESNEFASN